MWTGVLWSQTELWDRTKGKGSVYAQKDHQLNKTKMVVHVPLNELYVLLL